MKVDTPKLKAMISVGAVKNIDAVRSDRGFSVVITGINGNAHVLAAQRSDKRIFKTLDAVDSFLKSAGVESYSVN